MQDMGYLLTEKGTKIDVYSQDDLRMHSKTTGKEYIFPDVNGAEIKSLMPDPDSLSYHTIRTRFLPQIPEGGLLLDVGCCNWPHVSEHYKTVGIDFQRDRMEEAQKMIQKDGANYIQVSSSMPLKSNVFDAVVAVYNVVGDTKMPPGTLDEMLRVCKHGGTIMIVESKSVIDDSSDLCAQKGLDFLHISDPEWTDSYLVSIHRRDTKSIRDFLPASKKSFF